MICPCFMIRRQFVERVVCIEKQEPGGYVGEYSFITSRGKYFCDNIYKGFNRGGRQKIPALLDVIHRWDGSCVELLSDRMKDTFKDILILSVPV